MTNAQLDGRSAVVTGAGRGIGRALAERLAALGVRVLLVARTADELDAAATAIRETGGTAETLRADLAADGAPAEVAAAATERLGGVDILVNNAAVVAPLASKSSTVGVEEWTRSMTLNVTAPVMLTFALLPGMLDRGWGRVVNVSTGAVARPGSMIGGNSYITTKAALEGHTLNLAAELDGSGVTANVYRPGLVDTAMQAWIRDQDPDRIGTAMHDRFIRNHEDGRLLTADASARVLIGRIAGDETGRVWSVDDPAPVSGAG
ncbi:MAG TPA: SDR family oxidoreductase [Streptosporangiaceae bacterium]|jgi:3-oxoacyl-[acyl-carrier protein] reductase